jgi:amino acid transporter
MAVVATFLPFLFVFAAMIRVQSRNPEKNVRRVPGGRPVAIAVAAIGLTSTLLTIALAVVPSGDDPNPTLAVAKIVGGTMVLIGAGVVVFLVARFKQHSRSEC